MRPHCTSLPYRTIFFAAVCFLSPFLTGCNTIHVPYVPTSKNEGGYASNPIGDGIHRAYFEGPIKYKSQFADLALLHAAEMTAGAGFSSLVLLDQHAETFEKRVYVKPVPAQRERVTMTRPNGTTYEKTVTTMPAIRGGYFNETWERWTITFKMSSDASNSTDASVQIIDVQSTLSHLKRKYRL